MHDFTRAVPLLRSVIGGRDSGLAPFALKRACVAV